MRKINVILLVISVFFLQSCMSEAPAPTTDGSTLTVPTDTLRLTKTDSVKTLLLNLSCGCGFSLEVASLNGDTNTIKYLFVENKDDVVSSHTLRFSYSPSNFLSNPAPLTLNFLAHKHTYSYTNKVSVKIEN
ncbi:MAG: hypothetical protein ABI778_11430 [Ignavibacteriota bacterium]